MTGAHHCMACIVLISAFLISGVHAETINDLVFATRGQQELKLNLALPDTPGTMRPTVICIHGGAWQSGKRQSYDQLIKALAYRGYVAATIDYRLTGVAPWPAQWDDVTAAHRWLVDHSEKYGIDPERIGVAGDSAGGHLALLLGMIPNETSDRRLVRGVINYFGPTDLQAAKVRHALDAIEPLIGGKVEEHRDLLREISPLTHVSRTDSPVLTFHGTDDQIVPFEDHAPIFHQALNRAHVPNHLEVMQGAGHHIGRDRDKYNRLFADFVHRYLKATKLPMLAHEDFDDGWDRWETPGEASVKARISGQRSFYYLPPNNQSQSTQQSVPRNLVLLKALRPSDLVFDTDLRFRDTSVDRGLCLVFSYQDPKHFYYVHLSATGKGQECSIYLVDGNKRNRISTNEARLIHPSRGWHRARITRTVANGQIEVFFDDMQTPVLSAVDQSLGAGRIGFGSSGNAGDFDSIRVYGNK